MGSSISASVTNTITLRNLFEQEELTGYLKNMLPADKLGKNDVVKVYAKLPGWFKVPTPLGTYNPGLTLC